jgi:curved DNA-binding protein CbpA
MGDFFLLLGFARLPWLEPGEVKARFLDRSASLHPDRLHQSPENERLEAQSKFTELNAAHSCLSHSPSRLRHLLELESGAKPHDIQAIPPELTDLLFECGQLCRKIDAFISARKESASPLLQVEHFRQAMAQASLLEEIQRKFQAKRAELERELKALNLFWETAPTSTPERLKSLPLERLEEIYRQMAFLFRWSDQVRQRILQLTFP